MPVFVGWDCSSAIIGVCVLDGDEVKFWKTINLSVVKTMSEKYKLARLGIIDVFGSLDCLGVSKHAVHVVEERLGGFTGGFTTQQTLMTLAAINAVCTAKIEQMSDRECLRYLPVTVKATVKLHVPKKGSKKEAAVKFCIDRLGDKFPYIAKKKTKKQPYTEGHWVDGVDDLADAYLLALTGQKKTDGTRS